MTLGAWGQVTNAAGDLFGSEYLRDYAHASKVFRTNSYEKAPKLKFLFHTYFEINSEAYPDQTNFGLMVKDVRLPSFTFKNKQLNQYNRKRVVQTKINYTPVEINFHDDNGDNINKLWEAYYRYYYYDGTNPSNVLSGGRGVGINNPSSDYNSRNIYEDDLTSSGGVDWGFSGGQTSSDGKKVPFFKNITIFGLHQHKFTAYTLINPVITEFSHDSYNYSEVQGTMANKMTVDYETVVYNYGTLDGSTPGNIVTGFGDGSDYDLVPSPIMGKNANQTVLGQGGLVDAAGGAIESFNEGNVLGAIRNASAVYNGLKNPNLVENVATEALVTLINSFQNTPTTRNTNFNFPSAGQIPGPLALANTPTVNAISNPPLLTTDITNAGYVTNASNYVNQYSSKGFPVDIPFGFNQTDINNT